MTLIDETQKLLLALKDSLNNLSVNQHLAFDQIRKNLDQINTDQRDLLLRLRSEPKKESA